MSGNIALNYSLKIENIFKNITGADISRDNLVHNFNDELFLILNFLKSNNYFKSTEFNYWYEMYKLPDNITLVEALNDTVLNETLMEFVSWLKHLKYGRGEQNGTIC